MKAKAGKAGMLKTTISIDSKKWKGLRKLAVDKDVSASAMLESIIRAYVRRRGRK